MAVLKQNDVFACDCVAGIENEWGGWDELPAASKYARRDPLMGRTDPFSGPGGNFWGLSIQAATLAGRRAVPQEMPLQPLFFSIRANCGSDHRGRSGSAPRGSSFRKRIHDRSDI